MVGASGVGVQRALLAFTIEVTGFHHLISAVIAIAGSVVWNIALTNPWVSCDRTGYGTERRGVLSAALTVGALGTSVPLIFFHPSVVDLHDPVSSPCSIVALARLHFFVADWFIWQHVVTNDGADEPDRVTAADVPTAPRVVSPCQRFTSPFFRPSSSYFR